MTPPHSAAESCPVLLVKAFAAAPLQGNGAAVVRLAGPADAAWMQAVAASLNQSETAFLWQQPGGAWAIRWFTPSCEVRLCGHATLAACLALGHWQLLDGEAELCLASRSGGLTVRRLEQPAGAASLVLPTGVLQPLTAPDGLASLVGGVIEGYWGSELGYRVALLPPSVPLADLEPLAPRLNGADRNGLVLMQAATEGTPRCLGEASDYQLRFFAPGLGIDEDPVTGSAHALVAPWWMQQLGRRRVVGWQCSPRRGGMHCELARAGYVRLTGTGHLLWDGQLNAGGSGHDWVGWQNCHSS
jgi:predicted PhzF superfamily epimerase YddE/YHI9